MSLFENDEYQWRETYFIFFRSGDRPSAEKIEQTLSSVGRYQIRNTIANDAGVLESLTLISPDDYAAMDISCSRGEEVTEQLAELIPQLLQTAGSDEERSSIKQLADCDNRLDVYHFEQMVFVGRSGDEDSEDDFMEPGSLLIVMEQLAGLCNGIVVDPQAGCLL